MAPGIPLRLIGTSDLHAYIYPYDYYRDRPDETVGLAKTAALISAARAEATNSLLLDNGDFIQGAPLFSIQNVRWQHTIHREQILFDGHRFFPTF